MFSHIFQAGFTLFTFIQYRVWTIIKLLLLAIFKKHPKEAWLHTKVKKSIFSSFAILIIPIFVGLSTSDTISDPDLSVENILHCRADSILSFNVGGSAPNGAVFAMDIYPYSGGPSTQTLFSIRDGSTNLVSFAAELSDSTNEITFYRKDSITSLLTAVATPSLTLTKSDYN